MKKKCRYSSKQTTREVKRRPTTTKKTKSERGEPLEGDGYMDARREKERGWVKSDTEGFEATIMESDDSDLTKMAEKLESEILAKIKFASAHVIDLDRLLCDTFIRHSPKPLDYHNRRDLVRIFNVITKEIYGNSVDSPAVEEYGSFVMDMFNEKSDLDLSINFNNSIEVPRRKKILTLHKFNKKLLLLQNKGHVTGLQLIWSAKVPIVKVTDSGTGIECDLSVDNRDGIAKSHIIHVISAIDERFQKLCFLMKSWAKAHDINSPKDSTLSSFSIVSFVAFHLQTCNPPILPPFSILLEEGDDPASIAKVVKNYFNYGKQNKESLAKLFITLFVKLASVEKLWQKGLCASLYEGSWILKSWKRSYSISVEDFIDRSQNVARAVGSNQVKTIYRCIHKSLDYLMQFLNGQSQGNTLMDVLFEKHTASTLEVEVTGHIDENKNKLPTLQNPHPPKKRRLVENQVRIPSEKKSVQGLQGTEPQSVGWMQQTLGETVRNVHASFTPPVSYHPPFAISSTNIKVNHCYSQGTTPHFSLNPAAFERSYNPYIQSDLVSSQRFVHQKAVTPNPNLRSIHSLLPQVGHNPYRERAFYIHRSGGNRWFRSSQEDSCRRDIDTPATSRRAPPTASCHKTREERERVARVEEHNKRYKLRR
ncbi:Poly(A) RNA polymerase GLD2 [Spatholobus suberectus]|nr:Poly(A) RNA polymerase GLD2 [Spatholobus suberectus]